MKMQSGLAQSRFAPAPPLAGELRPLLALEVRPDGWQPPSQKAWQKALVQWRELSHARACLFAQ